MGCEGAISDRLWEFGHCDVWGSTAHCLTGLTEGLDGISALKGSCQVGSVSWALTAQALPDWSCWSSAGAEGKPSTQTMSPGNGKAGRLSQSTGLPLVSRSQPFLAVEEVTTMFQVCSAALCWRQSSSRLSASATAVRDVGRDTWTSSEQCLCWSHFGQSVLNLSIKCHFHAGDRMRVILGKLWMNSPWQWLKMKQASNKTWHILWVCHLQVPHSLLC